MANAAKTEVAGRRPGFFVADRPGSLGFQLGTSHTCARVRGTLPAWVPSMGAVHTRARIYAQWNNTGRGVGLPALIWGFGIRNFGLSLWS